MTESITVRIAESKEELEHIFNIRRVVFVEEQKVDEREEYDEFEETSTHLIAYHHSTPVGTCRFRNTNNGIKLERFAVLSVARGNQVGKKLVEKCLEKVDLSQYVYLHAQIQVVDFYAKFGFVAEGPQFEEAGIQHFKMAYKPTSP